MWEGDRLRHVLLLEEGNLAVRLRPQLHLLDGLVQVKVEGEGGGEERDSFIRLRAAAVQISTSCAQQSILS